MPSVCLIARFLPLHIVIASLLQKAGLPLSCAEASPIHRQKHVIYQCHVI